MKYRRIPLVFDVVQWTGKNTNEVIDFVGPSNIGPIERRIDYTLIIKTLEGNHRAMAGDYIIKGVNGECWPCKPEIFEKTYEKVTE